MATFNVLTQCMIFTGLFTLIHVAEIGDAFVSKDAIATPSVLRTSLPGSSRFLSYQDQFDQRPSSSSLMMASDEKAPEGLPFWLDPGTRGGAVVLSAILFIVPLMIYSVATNVFGVDGVDAGKYIGVGFTAVATLLWVSTYIFRVATKDMTYAKQLKDYENAVIAKRLEELDDDEIQALVEEIDRDEF